MRHKIFFLFLLPVFYVVHAVRPYYRYLSVREVFTMMGIYLLLTAVMFGIARLVVHNTRKAAFISFMLMVLFFFWGYVQIKLNLIAPGSFITRIRWLIPLWILGVTLLSVAFLRSKDTSQQRLIFFLNILFAIYILVDAGTIGYELVAGKKKNPVHLKTIAATPKNRPDVYFLLFDEYAGTKSLKENLHYDNSAIDSFLNQKGFTIQTSNRANYNITPFSMTSMLNMDYLTLKKTTIDIDDINKVVTQLPESATLRNFHDAGYDLVNASIFDFDQQPSLITETFLPVKTRLITANTFYDQVIKNAMAKYGIGAQTRWISLDNYDSYYNFNNKILRLVKDNAATQHSDPQFVYAHFVMPHTPYYFDKNGNKENPKTSFDATQKMDPAYYLYNLQHTNKELIPLVNELLHQKNGNVVIVLMGDHGFKKMVHATDSSSLFQNMCAIYFPDKDYRGFYNSISNINIFRLVNNKVLGTSYPLIPDSSILLGEDIK